MKVKPVAGATPRTVRCAIYTRKSSEEGLQQEFNTLDAQRESGEAYIAAQKHEGWTCLPVRYDDGGFTGGNMDRPALKRLIADIDAGKVDCVVVYKVDRLSRSLLDFARIMETFDKHKVSFVSVTQQFNTTHSMGRLTLNILLSFAQFEREIISERTRDKIAAARRKGKFAGGRPVLGYDIVSGPTGARLILNPKEAEQVRAIFSAYLQQKALVPTVRDLNQRRWTTKRWVAKAGTPQGGRAFGKSELYKLLTNVLYIGNVRHHDAIYPGEHERIVDEKTWQQVQAMLLHNGRSGGSAVRNKYGALLKGLLSCGPCGCSMGHAYSSRNSKRYRYYVCLNAQKRGWASCPTKSVPAGEIEQFVVDQIRAIGRDPSLLAETLRQVRAGTQAAVNELTQERERLTRKVASIAGDTELEQRLTEVRERLCALEQEQIKSGHVRAAMTSFDPIWDALSRREQARILVLLIERVVYDGKAGTVSLTFRPSGIKELVGEAEVAA